MSPRKVRPLLALFALLAAIALEGCENSSVGTLTVGLSGVPLDGTQNVVLAIKAVDAGGDGGRTGVVFGSEQLVNLDAGRTNLPSGLVPAGDYNWVRLEINPADSYVIAADGNRYPLAAAETYQAALPFTVAEGQTAKMAVSIDLRQALEVQTQRRTPVYTLKPVLRLVNLATAREIIGTAPTSLMIGILSITDPACVPRLYVYQGAGVTPEGFFVPAPGGTAPFASGDGILHMTQDIFTFDVVLLPTGTYTAAVACAATDVPGATNMAFSPTQTTVVSVNANGNVTF